MQVRSTSFNWLNPPIYVHVFTYLPLFCLVNSVYFPSFQSGRFFFAANIVIKYIISNTVKPCGETGQIFK